MHFKEHPIEDQIVVTGYGAITPLGHDVERLYNALLKGESAVRLVEPVDGVDERKWMSACIEGFDPKEHVHPRKTIKVMCREIQMAFGAAMQACRMAGISPGSIEPDRLGTVFSGEIILSDSSDVAEVVRRCAANGEMDHSRWAVEAMENIHPLWMLKSLPNMAACHVGITLDARGPNNTITTEATSGLGAILEAVNVIRRGKADVIVVGSSASRTCFTRLLQRYEEDYSRATSIPQIACKPFDSERDGSVPGESASSIILERRSHAEARGVPILGSIVGWANMFGPSKERWGGTQASTENTLKTLIQRSGLSPQEIDHINAAANGTIRLDAAQARGIASTLKHVPVVSYKGGLGDSISGSGVIELIASIEGMRRGAIAPTANHTKTGMDCPINVVSKSSKPRTGSSVVKLSNTPQGHCIGIAMTFENS